MEFITGLHATANLNVEETRRRAEQAGFTAFVFPETGIVSRESFFDAVRATFPLDPPLVGFRSWDALSDSLWEGLYRHPSQKIAILWKNTRAIADIASTEFDTALAVLSDVAKSLADARATCNQPKDVAIFVECYPSQRASQRGRN